MKRKTSTRKSISTLKKKAWKVFSQYIRQKGSDWRGNAECVTCAKIAPWKTMHAGHFIAGRGNTILFEETNVHPQCYVCNVRKHGDQLNYYRFMVSTYGEDEVIRLTKLSKKTHPFTRDELTTLIQKYENNPNR